MQQLVVEYGRGFTYTALTRMVGFFAAFPDEAIVATLSQQLSWSHFRELLPLKQPLQREYYAEMCRLERWSVRTLRQRIDSMLYERTALSRKPEKLIEHELDHLRNTERVTPDLLMRDPYMLDFLGLQDIYIEDDLEAAIVREMEKFLLELGAGFSFVARQKRVQLDDEIRDNLKDVQLRAGLRPSESLDSGDFTVEMETGTGKTYVYLRTIFELNRRFGFIKFVIVVPSVTIRQSVYKTLQITEEHFRKNSRPSGTASSTRRPIAFFSTSSN